nr:MAG TPA: hypothetical protein [Caudoviricetes sp.]
MKKGTMRALISSPYRGDIEKNVKKRRSMHVKQP